MPRITVTNDAAAKNIASLAAELGLTTQATRYAASNSIERDFVPLSDDEFLVWSLFCGKAYSTAEELAGYAFDTIPAEILQYWKRLKDNYAFDRFEVRTTASVARQHQDPLLIGYFGPKAYLLARWGLESPEALPIREVAKKVADMLWATNPHDYEYVGFFQKRVFNGKLMWPPYNRHYEIALKLAK